MKKRLFALICAVCMITVMAAHGHAEKEEYTVTEKSVAMYISSVENKQDFKVYYINGGCIPYISVRNVGTLIEISSIIGTDGGYSPFLHLKTDGDHAVYTLADGPYTMDIDFTHDTITFMDYDAFYRAEDLALVDLVWTPPYMSKLFRKSELCMDRYGKVLTFDLGHYGIDLVHTADGYYLPVQTVIDLLLSYYCNTVVFNGEALIFGPLDAELTAVLYDGSGEWNEEFALFNYNELCCALDYQYGLKDIHGIETFDQLYP